MSTLLKLSAPIPERVVQVPGGEGFAVRGLNPYNVVSLYRRHMGELEPMFQSLMAAARVNGAASTQDILPLLLALVSKSPVLMGELIAVATGGDPVNEEMVTIFDPRTSTHADLPAFEATLVIAMALPFTVQVDALSKIAELTFSQDMPPGKFVALVLAIVHSATGAVQAMADYPTLAPNGSGVSVDPSTI